MPLYQREAIMRALNSPIRWKIIQSLCEEPMGAGSLAQIVGGDTSSVRKHMKVLLRAGICVQGKGQFYKVSPHFQPPPGAPRVLDFGHCIIRLAPQPPVS
jgi:DNA-binding transcriptional ArsR family regulator